MKRYRSHVLVTILLIVIVGALLAACGSSEEAMPTSVPAAVDTPVPPPPTDTPAPPPTDTPPPPPTETPTPDVTADFTTLESAEGGYAIDYPANWFTDGFGGINTFASAEELLDAPDPGEEGGVAIVIGGDTAEFDGEDAVARLTQAIEEIDIVEEVEFVQEPTAITINGQEAATAVMQGDADNGTPLMAFMTLISKGDQTIIMIAATPAETEPEFRPIFEAMADSIQVKEPVAAPLPESDGILFYGDTAAGSITDASPATWEFIGLEGEVIDVIVRPKTEEFDAILDLLDESGNSVLEAEIDDSFGVEELRDFTLPTSGSYLIAISGFANSTGDYEVTLAEAGSLVGAEGAISYGETLAGSVTAEEGSTWGFTGGAGDFVDITVLPLEEFDLVVDVFDPSGSSLLEEGPLDDSFDTEFIRILPLPDDGAYTIVVTGYEGEVGDYEITLDLSNGGQPGSIIFAADTLTEDDEEGHAFPFTAQSGEVVTFQVDPEFGFDNVIELYDDDTDELLAEVDDTTGYEELLYTVPEEGNYYFLVKGFEGGAGDYEATLLGSSTVIFELALGDEVVGRFDEDAIIDYLYRGVAGDTILITAESNEELDLTLELSDLDDNILVTVDEMSAGSAEVVAYEFIEDQIIFIRVAEFFGQQGQFSLTLDLE